MVFDMDCRDCPYPCEDGGKYCYLKGRDYEQDDYEGVWSDSNATSNYPREKRKLPEVSIYERYVIRAKLSGRL